MFRGRVRHIHFVGIGGIGMSGIAEVLLANGYKVSGTDGKESDNTKRLRGLGAVVLIGHKAEHVRGADVVVYSSAVPKDNPELVEARVCSIPVIPRAEMLAELMRIKDGIAIAGSHGKTTTTSLVATVLREAGMDPTVIIGGKLNALGSNAAHGEGELLVAEADESDGSFLHLSPVISIVTNIDAEHLDHYGTHEKVKDAFVEFANRIPFYGLVVACLDHPHVQDILPRMEKRIATYGFAAQADYRARNAQVEGLKTRFELLHRGVSQGEFTVNMPGIHNVLNALAVIAVADELQVPRTVLKQALASFSGVQRRFTVKGQYVLPEGGEPITVVDDYGHHPAEIQVTLEAAQRAYGKRIVVLFQPHRYSRTLHCFDDLIRAFNRADVVLLGDVYAAGEAVISSATSEKLSAAMRAHGHRDVTHIPGHRMELVRAARARLLPGDIVITLGAGDITKAGPELLEWLDKGELLSQSTLTG